MCFASVSAKAQTVWYKATAYSVATVHNGYYKWSDWYSSSVKMKIDWDNDYIIIYSNKKQSYIITRTVSTLHSDSKGGKEAEFRVLDGDGDTGGLRLRIDKYGNYQIYIDFADVAWVYSIVRI